MGHEHAGGTVEVLNRLRRSTAAERHTEVTERPEPTAVAAARRVRPVIRA